MYVQCGTRHLAALKPSAAIAFVWPPSISRLSSRLHCNWMQWSCFSALQTAMLHLTTLLRVKSIIIRQFSGTVCIHLCFAVYHLELSCNH